MALKAKGIAASPGMLLYIFVPLTIIYAFNFILSSLVVAFAYIIQVQSAAWYVKFTDIIFGPPDLIGKQPEQAIARPVEETTDEKTTAGQEPSMVADIKKILFASDISKTARFAARYACGIGHKFNAKVWVIHVVPDLLEAYSSEAGILVSDDKNQTADFNKKAMDDAKQLLRERIRHTSKQVLAEIPFCPLDEENIIITAGNPVDQIVKIA